MSIIELSKINSYSFHRRNDSGELDVFEAARYFSGVCEISDDYNAINIPHKSISERVDRRPARMRLDSIVRNPVPPQNNAMQQKKINEIKKNKQPSSPGGRLASFLNLLFNHTSSKKYKSESTGTIKNLEQAASKIYPINPKDTASEAELKSTHPCSSSGFRTPQLAFSNTPQNPDDDFVRIFYPKNGGNLKAKFLHDAFYFDRISIEKKLRIDFKNSTWIDDEYPSEEKGFRKLSDADGGADTDSSSDLFDLPNHDLDFYGNGLPVYETTRMNNLR